MNPPLAALPSSTSLPSPPPLSTAAYQGGQCGGQGEGHLCGRPHRVHQRTQHRGDAALRGGPDAERAAQRQVLHAEAGGAHEGVR